jgi:hypothetical protein
MQRTVSVLGDVKDLGDLLEGASIDSAKLLPAGQYLRLDMELTRACRELPKSPWARSRLTLGLIKDVAVGRAPEVPGAHPSLIGCEAVAGGYRLTVTSRDRLQLSLTLDRLSGEFSDIGQPVVVG